MHRRKEKVVIKMSIEKQRKELIKTILGDQTTTDDEDEILHLLLEKRVSKNPVAEREDTLSFGQKAADGLAKFAGSWTFILIFMAILTAWIAVNGYLLTKPYDPFPFILLNLILSCIAAIQAPVIMMSQNRQEEKDRARAKNDYMVNLKSEIIIEDIHQTLDEIVENQKQILERIERLEK